MSEKDAATFACVVDGSNWPNVLFAAMAPRWAGHIKQLDIQTFGDSSKLVGLFGVSKWCSAYLFKWFNVEDATDEADKKDGDDEVNDATEK